MHGISKRNLVGFMPLLFRRWPWEAILCKRAAPASSSVTPHFLRRINRLRIRTRLGIVHCGQGIRFGHYPKLALFRYSGMAASAGPRLPPRPISVSMLTFLHGEVLYFQQSAQKNRKHPYGLASFRPTAPAAHLGDCRRGINV